MCSKLLSNRKVRSSQRYENNCRIIFVTLCQKYTLCVIITNITDGNSNGVIYYCLDQEPLFWLFTGQQYKDGKPLTAFYKYITTEQYEDDGCTQLKSTSNMELGKCVSSDQGSRYPYFKVECNGLYSFPYLCYDSKCTVCERGSPLATYFCKCNYLIYSISSY